ncbi:hypothetical protein HDV05_005122, partial [Chytridiales sp. JEL 0842]
NVTVHDIRHFVHVELLCAFHRKTPERLFDKDLSSFFNHGKVNMNQYKKVLRGLCSRGTSKLKGGGDAMTNLWDKPFALQDDGSAKKSLGYGVDELEDSFLNNFAKEERKAIEESWLSTTKNMSVKDRKAHYETIAKQKIKGVHKLITPELLQKLYKILTDNVSTDLEKIFSIGTKSERPGFQQSASREVGDDGSSCGNGLLSPDGN